MNISDTAKAISAIVAVIMLAFSGFFFFENRYTSQPMFYALEKRVSLNELRRQLRQAEEDEAHYDRLLRKYPGDEKIEKKLEKVQKRIEKLEKQIEKREESGEEE